MKMVIFHSYVIFPEDRFIVWFTTFRKIRGSNGIMFFLSDKKLFLTWGLKH